MAKEIVVITGSPRQGGNTDLLVEAFIRGAGAVGHKTYKFAAAHKAVQGCWGCDKCWSAGTEPCVIKDDFYELVPRLETCDGLVLASPVYFWGFTAQIKAVIDRFYAYTKEPGRKRLTVKQSALLLVLGDTADATYKHTLGSYKDIADYMGWTDLGVIIAKGVHGKADIMGHEALIQAEALGKTFYQ